MAVALETGRGRGAPLARAVPRLSLPCLPRPPEEVQRPTCSGRVRRSLGGRPRPRGPWGDRGGNGWKADSHPACQAQDEPRPFQPGVGLPHSGGVLAQGTLDDKWMLSSLAGT